MSNLPSKTMVCALLLLALPAFGAEPKTASQRSASNAVTAVTILAKEIELDRIRLDRVAVGLYLCGFKPDVIRWFLGLPTQDWHPWENPELVASEKEYADMLCKGGPVPAVQRSKK